jgi:hypothetical protein
MRSSMARATEAKLNGTESRVHLAVLSLTGTWSRLSDYCYTEQIATLSGVRPKTTREILGKLGRLGVIVYSPARGRHRRSLIGLPLDAEKAPGSEALSDPPEKAPESGALSGEKAPGSGAEKTPGSEAPTEKHPRSKQQAAASRSRDEPEEFTKLLDGIPLKDEDRRVILEAWEREPGRVTRCTAEYRHRLRHGTARRPGLLVRMVEDGDDFRGGSVTELRSPMERAMRWAETAGWEIAPEDRIDVMPARDELTEAQRNEVLTRCEVVAAERARAA